MCQDAFSYVHTCNKCRAQKLVSYGTLYHIMIAPQWSEYIVDYLQTHILPANISLARKRAIEIEARNYTLIGNQMYHRGKDQQLRLCVTEAEYIPILEQAHAGIAGGHFSSTVTARAIMTSGLWWPTLFQDADEFVKRCDTCQRTKTPIQKDNMPLRPIIGARAFDK